MILNKEKNEIRIPIQIFVPLQIYSSVCKFILVLVRSDVTPIQRQTLQGSFTYYVTLYSGFLDTYPLVTQNHTNPQLFKTFRYASSDPLYPPKALRNM